MTRKFCNGLMHYLMSFTTFITALYCVKKVKRSTQSHDNNNLL